MKKSDVEDMKEILKEFIKERDWEQFHNPKDLAMALSIEANELLEIFQWTTLEELPVLIKEKRKEISSEVADILHYLVAFSITADIDLYGEFMKKLEHNKKRYPKDKVKGKKHKYTYY